MSIATKLKQNIPVIIAASTTVLAVGTVVLITTKYNNSMNEHATELIVRTMSQQAFDAGVLDKLIEHQNKLTSIIPKV